MWRGDVLDWIIISIHALLAESDTLGGNQGRCGISIHTLSQGMTGIYSWLW